MVSSLLSNLASVRMRSFLQSHREPVRAQHRVLENLLRRAQDTEWGRRWGFRDVDGPQAFRERVPLTGYEASAPDWQRAFGGERDIAWPGHVRYFAMSSGTTGRSKYLPVTADALASNRRAGSFLLAAVVRQFGPETVSRGKSLYLGGSTSLCPRGSSLVGDASGIMGRHVPLLARPWYLPEADIAAIPDWEEKIARLVERYATADVRLLSACPSWAIPLFRVLAQHSGRSAGEAWPNLGCLIPFGTAFAPYRRALRECLGRDLPCLESYSSSEGGMTAFQEEPGGPLRLIVDNGVYFEFVPADRANDPQPPRLGIEEVEEGREYALVLSTNGGIWAYPLGDVVRLVSLRPPRIVFVGRVNVSLNAFGEHVTGEEMEAAVSAACDSTGAAVVEYTIVPVFAAGPGRPPHHRWLVEFERAPADPAAFAAALDGAIQARNADYGTHRRGDFGIGGPEVVALPAGSFQQWMASLGKLGGQHKVPRVLTDGVQVESLLAVAAALRGS